MMTEFNKLPTLETDSYLKDKLKSQLIKNEIDRLEEIIFDLHSEIETSEYSSDGYVHYLSLIMLPEIANIICEYLYYYVDDKYLENSIRNIKFSHKHSMSSKISRYNVNGYELQFSHKFPIIEILEISLYKEK